MVATDRVLRLGGEYVREWALRVYILTPMVSRRAGRADGFLL